MTAYNHLLPPTFYCGDGIHSFSTAFIFYYLLIIVVVNLPSLIVMLIYVQGVILREWQGITFMMLDILNTFSISLATVIQVLFKLLTCDMHLSVYELNF